MGESLEAEGVICQGYWESTYGRGVGAGTAGVFTGQVTSAYMALTANNGVALPMSMPRFLVPKRYDPSAVTVYVPSSGTAGSIQITGPGASAVTVNNASTHGFELLNNTGAAITGASIASPYHATFHYVADSEM